MKLKFTRQFQMASLSVCPQFETNLMSNRKVIELLLKCAKTHGKTTQKSDLPWSAIFSVIVYSHKIKIFYDLQYLNRRLPKDGGPGAV